MPEIDVSHGIKELIYSVLALIGVRVLSDFLKGIWLFVNRRKIPTREELQNLTEALRNNTESIMNQKALTIKMSQDLKRIYLFLKVIAGEKWPAYRKQVEDLEKDEVTQ